MSSRIKWKKPSCVSMRAVYLKCKTFEIVLILFTMSVLLYYGVILFVHIEHLYKVGQRNLIG